MPHMTFKEVNNGGDGGEEEFELGVEDEEEIFQDAQEQIILVSPDQ